MNRVGRSYNSSALMPTSPCDWWEDKIAQKPQEPGKLAREPGSIILNCREGRICDCFLIFIFSFCSTVLGVQYIAAGFSSNTPGF